MFDKEIKFITDFNLNKVSPAGNGFTLSSLKEAGLHPAVLQFISAELDYLIFLDRKKLLQNSSFDYSGKVLSQYFLQMSVEIKKNKKLSYEAVKKLLLQAVSFNLNFLVRPKWSLNKLVFNEAESKSVEEIKYFLNYTYYYEFINKIFTIFAEKKKIHTLNTTEFENVFNKMESELVNNQLSEMLDYFLFSTAEFINQGEKKKYKIPLYLLENFLEEKKLISLLEKIKELDLEPKQKINVREMKSYLLSDNRADLAGILDYKTKDIPVQEPVSSTPAISLEIPELEVKDDFSAIEIPENDEFPSEEIYDTSAQMNDLAPEPVNVINSEISSSNDDKFPAADFKNILDDEIVKVKEEPELEEFYVDNQDEYIPDAISSVGDIPIEDTFYDKAPAEDTFTNSADEVNLSDFENTTEDDVKFEPVIEVELEPEGKIDISGFSDSIDEDFSVETEEPEKKSFKGQILLNKFNAVELKNITINVFNGDNDDCLNTIEHLAEADNYDKATEILQQLFFTYRVNPYSKDAVSLTNKVLNYFQLG